MMRVVVAVGMVLGGVRVAGAETLGAWTYAPPPGWEAKVSSTFVSYAKAVPPTYCMLALYAPRAPGADAATDAGTEWAQIVDPRFTSTNIKADPPRTTKQKLTAHAIGATLVDGTGASSYGRLIVLRGSVVGSVFVLSNDAKSMASCQPRVTAVIDSIQIKDAAPASSSSIVATWSMSSTSTDPSTGMSYGSQKRQLVLSQDRTYAMKFEMWGGHLGDGRWVTQTENGAYQVDGAKLVLTPTAGTSVVRDRDGKVLEKTKPKLAKTTFAWKLEYVEGLNETQLVLTGADGATRYSSASTLEWRY